MAAVSVFRARYTDETALYEHLRKICPTGMIQIRFQRGRFYCTVPRPLTPRPKISNMIFRMTITKDNEMTRSWSFTSGVLYSIYHHGFKVAS
ncbi:hypothetical protein F4677DRAFT_347252 [Hypoxylon crocopeplum]|nr:hypothetical protein F4677DRAFT_347252 [Hypoxylon crocopeplum]